MSVERVRDVAASRVGTFERLVLDLRELTEVDAGGVRELIAWASAGVWRGAEVGLTADDRVGEALAVAGAGLPAARAR
jgi:hypothetical protein